jgi:hypothetical protein
MAQKSKKRPIRRVAKAKKSAPKKKAPKRKAPKRSAAATRKAAAKAKPTRVTAKTLRQRAAKARPIRRVVELDEPRERADSEKVRLGKKGFETDDLSEEMGEAFVRTATSGEQADEDMRDEEVPEERGGPFVETTAREEFARGTDESNPRDAEPAALPTTSREED